MRLALLAIFKQWGLPCAIKTDNGDPFGVPKRDLIPVMSLWLIGWAIQPILNRPRHPQDNAKVERAQGTSSRWAEIKKANNLVDLQKRLDLIIQEQRDKYRVKRLGNVTRKQLFPDVYKNQRQFDESTFNIKAAHDFLASKTLERKVGSNGTIALYGAVFQVHLKFKKQTVFIKFNQQIIGWQILDTNRKEIKIIKDDRFDEQNIMLLKVCQ